MKRAVGWLQVALSASTAIWIVFALMDGDFVDVVARIALTVAVASAVALGALVLGRWFVGWAVRTSRLTAPAAESAIRTGGTSLLRGDSKRLTEVGVADSSSALKQIISTGGLSLLTAPVRGQQDQPLNDA